eukprot:gene5838-7451_t
MSDATSVYEAMSEIDNVICEGSAAVTIDHYRQYPALDDVLEELQEKFSVKFFKPQVKNKTKVRVIFNGSPAACKNAAKKLRLQTQPLVMKLVDRKQQIMTGELKQRGVLKRWADELHLLEESVPVKGIERENALIFILKVYGPAVSQGEFMLRIGDYSDQFEKRYRTWVLGNELSQFRWGRKGEKEVMDLDNKLGKSGTFRVVYHLQQLELVISSTLTGKKLLEAMSEVNAVVTTLLRDLGVSSTSLSESKNRRSCERYWRKKESKGNFNAEDLFRDAREFLTDNWLVADGIGPVRRIDNNPGIPAGCPSMQRYCKAAMERGGPHLLCDDQDQTFFAWHGTESTEAVTKICHDGFDPTRRSRQACGEGEYFGVSNAISHPYSKDSGLMI